eukprot:1447285-Amphidinium_carterae.1
MEPVIHRTPMPEPVLKSMVALALAFRWYRTGALLALIFYGILRPGEVAHATRLHLLLPRDHLLE